VENCLADPLESRETAICGMLAYLRMVRDLRPCGDGGFVSEDAYPPPRCNDSQRVRELEAAMPEVDRILRRFFTMSPTQPPRVQHLTFLKLATETERPGAPTGASVGVACSQLSGLDLSFDALRTRLVLFDPAPG